MLLQRTDGQERANARSHQCTLMIGNPGVPRQVKLRLSRAAITEIQNQPEPGKTSCMGQESGTRNSRRDSTQEWAMPGQVQEHQVPGTPEGGTLARVLARTLTGQ